MEPIQGTKVDISRALRQITSIVVLCGLFVLVLGGLGALVLSTDNWPIPKIVCFCLVTASIVYVFSRIWEKVGNIKEIVVDAEYYKLDILAKLIGGKTLTYFVEDKVHELLQKLLGRKFTADAHSEASKETGPLTWKRMDKDREKLDRRHKNEPTG